jgi:hypothetical protein
MSGISILSPDSEGSMAEEETDALQVQEPTTPIVNRAIDAPTIYADAAMLCSAFNGVVRISFVEHQPNPSDKPDGGWKTRYVGNLVMSASGFLGLADYLKQQSEALKAQGLLNVSG